MSSANPIGTAKGGAPISLGLERLVSSRMLVQAKMAEIVGSLRPTPNHGPGSGF